MADERAELRRLMAADETAVVRGLAHGLSVDTAAAHADAVALVEAVRGDARPGLMETVLAEYGLSTREGVALMCLAEALLRVPDALTIDALIADKIAPADWGAHLGRSSSSLVNASTWALLLTGKVLADDEQGMAATLRALVRRVGEPVVRAAVARAMQQMGRQFVLGRTIEEGLARAAKLEAHGYTYSYDMLGEGAKTAADAARYQRAYAQAIAAIAPGCKGDVRSNPGISVKLSALHPRYEEAKRQRVLAELVPRLLDLARAAAAANMGCNVDAEESERLELSLDVIEAVLSAPDLAGWDGFGLVVQSYAKTAPAVIDWALGLAERLDRRLMLRLVKGAYWDTEIKRAQVLGADHVPVFTRKSHSDVAYLACAEKLLTARHRFYPQFATHNAHTLAAVHHIAGGADGYEFQRLHGMGEALHRIAKDRYGTSCRIYAPVGAHRDLLAYLVRRLLENGANSSFVNQLVDQSVPATVVAKDPVATAAAHGFTANDRITRPADLFQPQRPNAKGFDLADRTTLALLEAARAPFRAEPWVAGDPTGPGRISCNPALLADVVGTIHEMDEAAAMAAIGRAASGAAAWAELSVAERATVLARAADLYEAHVGELFALLAREAGKTLPDAVAELREAADFLRYYAAEASTLPPASPLGVVACISPWNFPLAIFTGQIAGALAVGNAVVAKPAEQTPLIAARAVALLHAAGVPADALVPVFGDGRIGAVLTRDRRIGGVVFTGSTETAQTIHRSMAEHLDPTAPLIAETGGINAMLVDSTALPEQVVRDVLTSAFQSAGQRCSALRVLYLQREIAADVMAMLQGAMAELTVGDPWDLATDVGPVIDDAAKAAIERYIAAQHGAGRSVHRLPAPPTGRFVAPTLIEVEGIETVECEVFGPVLHVATFAAKDLERVVETINARGYGLTLGLHTRIDDRVQAVVERARVGNLYVNRNQIGAVVGSQPFGGEGLSGTGPKAGGPFYLPRLQRQPRIEVNAAAGAAADVQAVQKALADVRNLPTDRTRLAKVAPERAPLAAAAEALVTAPLDLPGPTGESNRLSRHPRGTGLCLGPNATAALDQAAALLAVGGRAVVVLPGATAALASWQKAGLAVHAVDGILAADALTSLDGFALVACAGDPTRLRALRRALAARQGPILSLVDASDLRDLVHERHLCIDTTAAGGNASLLAANGG
ncbi:MAG: bifunctional proline dehydrogenase/L-glutamate gamma-semialdehyde dehydrogenase PutA [Geminicoccaceae bacterium]|nr:MAG: bifunctional proline dehydrogenase/L-glutamate gamma-semialdehyde dehydrogenase PutA [Geminicoccaceae bacterium]